MVVRFTNFGAKVQQIIVPDRDGFLGDVALGYDSIAAVLTGQTSLGAFVGRYANRIGNARFSLDGVSYELAQNSGPNCLHGGKKGSRLRAFDVRQIDGASAELKLQYRAGEENFPGNLTSRVVYRVTDDNELSMEYEAVTDAPTVINFTSHGYFNLAGHGRTDAQTAGRHLLQIRASQFTPIDANSIPTGEYRSVTGTPLDFTRPRPIGERADEPWQQFEQTHGYDHNWILDKAPGEYALAASIYDPLSGRRMDVLTTEPGLQFFGGNGFTGEAPRDIGKAGAVYGHRAGFCLEPQHFPDSPNKPLFPSTVLRPGERFSGKITYRFGIGE
jgi:aldose 1-epimerase